MMSWMGSMIGREEGELDMSGEWGLGLGLFGRRLRLLISAASGRFGSRSPSESEEEAVLQDTLLRFMGATALAAIKEGSLLLGVFPSSAGALAAVSTAAAGFKMESGVPWPDRPPLVNLPLSAALGSLGGKSSSAPSSQKLGW